MNKGPSNWLMDVKGLVRYTPWETNIAIENAPVEIVDFPSKHGDFPISYVNVYQRVINKLMASL